MAYNYRKLISVTTIMFLIGLIAIAIPMTIFAGAANNTLGYFNVSLNITGNSPINITWIGSSSDSPQEATTINTYILFNVTDADGNTDLNLATMYVNITLSGVTIQSSSCTNYSTVGIEHGINCTVSIEYYREPGNWNISAYAADNSGSTDSEINYTAFTYSTLYAFRVEKSMINFTATQTGVNDVNASDDPQILNNTGNGGFTYINVTATDLTGPGTIGAGNFTINVTDAKGISLGSEVTISGASLPRGTTPEELFVWMDIPAVASGYYSSSSDWEVEAFN